MGARTKWPSMFAVVCVPAVTGCGASSRGGDGDTDIDADIDADTDADTCPNEKGPCDCIAECYRDTDCLPSQVCNCDESPCFCHFCAPAPGG